MRIAIAQDWLYTIGGAERVLQGRPRPHPLEAHGEGEIFGAASVGAGRGPLAYGTTWLAASMATVRCSASAPVACSFANTGDGEYPTGSLARTPAGAI
jgi:hypothetical protein